MLSHRGHELAHYVGRRESGRVKLIAAVVERQVVEIERG
jgi:hypothetical protein